MITFIFVILTYSILLITTIFRLKSINLLNLHFSDGLLVGLTFYIIIPFFFILFTGELYSFGIQVKPYNPYIDLTTTFNIFIGWIVVLLVQRVSKPKNIQIDITKKAVKFYFYIMLVLYFLFSIYSFYKTGMFSADAHWHESMVNSLASDSSLIIIKNFAFAYRTMLFGFIFYMYKRKYLSRKEAILLGGFISVFDLLTTFNRITFVYYFFLLFFIHIKFWKSLLISIFLLLPLISEFSNLWTTVRASNHGYSIESFSEAYAFANSLESKKTPFIILINGVFESSNILVLSYVSNNVGKDLPILYGKTFLLRPLTTFIPSSIWSDKPKVFGVYLGKAINNHKTLTLNSTLFGEAIGNFSYSWPFFLFFVLYLYNKIFRFIGKYIPASTFMGFFVGLALWRFDLNFASAALYSLVLILILRTLWNFSIKKNSKKRFIT